MPSSEPCDASSCAHNSSSTPFRFSAHLEGHAFVTGELRKQSYGDWEFEVRDPNGYILMFGGDVAIPKLSAGST